MRDTTLTFILLAVAFGLGLYIALFEVDRTIKNPNPTSKLVFQFNPEDITGIAVIHGDKTVALRRLAGENWMVVDQEKQVEAVADTKVAGQLATAVAQLRFIDKRDLTEENIDLATLGLIQPKMKIVVQLDNIQQEIAFGNEVVVKKKGLGSREKRHVFILVRNQNAVYRVPQYLKGIFKPNLFYYREKSLSQLTDQDVDYFVIRKDREVLEFFRHKDQWYGSHWPTTSKVPNQTSKNFLRQVATGRPLLAKCHLLNQTQTFRTMVPLVRWQGNVLSRKMSVQEPLPSSNVSGFLRVLSQLKASRILELTPENLNKLGARKSKNIKGAIGLFRGGRLKKYFPIWHDDQGRFYGMLEEEKRREILEIPRRIQFLMSRRFKHFRSPSIFPVAVAMVEKLTIEGKGKRVVVERKKNRWQVAESPQISLDSSRIEEFLGELTLLRIEKTLEWPKEIVRPEKGTVIQRSGRGFQLISQPLDLHLAGLDQPEMVVTVHRREMDETVEHKLVLGKPGPNGKYYGQRKYPFPIFLFSPGVLEKWREKGLLLFRSRRIIPRFSGVQKVVLRGGGKKLSLIRQAQRERFLPEGRPDVSNKVIYDVLEQLDQWQAIEYFRRSKDLDQEWFRRIDFEIEVVSPSEKAPRIFQVGPGREGKVAVREKGKEFAFFTEANIVKLIKRVLK